MQKLQVFVVLLLFLGSVVAAGLFLPRPPQAEHSEVNGSTDSSLPSTVILITVEATRSDHIGPCYGYSRQTAPNLCKIAQDGVRFEKAYAQSLSTFVAVPTLLTGMIPSRVGLDNFSQGMSNVSHLGAIFRHHGYDVIGGRRAAVLPSVTDRLKPWKNISFSRQKQFYWSFLLPPHTPYGQRQQFRLWDNTSLNRTALRDASYINGSKEWAQHIMRNVSLRNYIALYDQAIFKADTMIGRLIEKLKQEGVYKNALIIVTGDHATSLGEGGNPSVNRTGDWYREPVCTSPCCGSTRLTHHIACPYEEDIRVPLIVKFPDNRFAGTQIEQPVRHIDVVPTLLDYLNINDTADRYGTSLIPAIRQGIDLNLTVFAAASPSIHWTIREGEYKYFLLNAKDRCINADDGIEAAGLLHRLNDTDVETVTTRTRNMTVENRLEEQLCRIYRKGFARRPTIPETSMDKEMKEKLKQLGYLQ